MVFNHPIGVRFPVGPPTIEHFMKSYRFENLYSEKLGIIDNENKLKKKEESQKIIKLHI